MFVKQIWKTVIKSKGSNIYIVQVKKRNLNDSKALIYFI